MEDSQIEHLEYRMSLIAKIAVLFQCGAAIIALLILYFHPNGSREIGRAFSITALFSSCIISKIYIYTGKKLEAIKIFTLEEVKKKKREYFTNFFSAYVLWILFTVIFGYA